MTYRSPIVFLALVLLWGPALAHHSTSIYMTDDLRSITGVVTEYEWRNPHTYIQLEVTTLDGQKYLRDIEAGAISWLRPLGLSANSLDVGDQITVRAFPPRRPRSEIYLGRELITEDGRVLPLNSLSPFIEGVSSTGTTSDIAGIWVMENDAWEVFEQEQRSSWALTDAGRAAIARHDGVATPQAECVPMSVPHLMLYPVVAQFSIEQSTQAVQIRVDWMKSERTIYLDGRDHPPSSESFLFGHSVGRWEGDTEGTALHVETTNFALHDAGTGYGIPSGDDKRVIETFRLSDDGQRMTYAGVLESPEYLAEPASWRFVFNYRPDLEHSEQECDLDAARRFQFE